MDNFLINLIKIIITFSCKRMKEKKRVEEVKD